MFVVRLHAALRLLPEPEIAAGHSGKGRFRWDRLAEIFLELQEKGAHNINLVTPTHYSVCLAEALKKARRTG